MACVRSWVRVLAGVSARPRGPAPEEATTDVVFALQVTTPQGAAEVGVCRHVGRHPHTHTHHTRTAHPHTTHTTHHTHHSPHTHHTYNPISHTHTPHPTHYTALSSLPSVP
jgi:hypothetical protein